MKRIRPIVRWPGGKSRLLAHLFPLPQHGTYVEPFAGGLAVLLAKPPSAVEIVNDLNDDLVCLYRVAQFHLDALICELAFMLHSRKNMRDFIRQPGLTDIQRAARFLARNRCCFGSNMESYAVVRKPTGGLSSRKNVEELLRRFNERLDRVSVENQSYERCLEVYDGPASLFFMAPPYLNSKASTYRGWNEQEMTQFADRVKALEGQWIVTVDDSRLNRELFADYQIKALRTWNGACNQRTDPGRKFGELIIRSSPLKAARSATIRRPRLSAGTAAKARVSASVRERGRLLKAPSEALQRAE